MSHSGPSHFGTRLSLVVHLTPEPKQQLLNIVAHGVIVVMECPTHQLPWLACHSTALPLAGMQLCAHMYKPISLQPRTVVLWLFLQLCKGNGGRPWMEAIALVYTLHIIFPELASVSLFC